MLEAKTWLKLVAEGAVRGLMVVWSNGLVSWVRRMEEEDVDEGEEGEAIAADPLAVVAAGLPGMRNVADRVT